MNYDEIANIINKLGSPSFADTLLRALNHECTLNHLSLVHLEERDQITYILSASNSIDAVITKTMQKLYLSIYYRQDPNKEFLDAFNEHKTILIQRIQQQDIKDQGYKALWYEKMNIIDRVSILTKADKGVYCLNMFRTQQPFSDGDIKVITELSHLLSELTVKHTRLSGSLSNFMTRDDQIETLIERLARTSSNLTQREKDVCSRILLGMSSEGIGIDLGIKKQSVLTYRKRAYARLSISSQNELFALCLTIS